MDYIDLRSDTVTQPTPEMREAMANAQVGDDVYGEDTTMNELERLSASVLGKEAGLFIPSGTMGNLIAILAHCGRGDEVILGDKAHTVLYEAGGIAALGGVHPRQIPNQFDGTLKLDDIQNAIRTNDIHFPTTKLITLENTHNRCGGVSLSAEYTDLVGKIAQENNIKLHLDGARIFNASIAESVSPKRLVSSADSVTFCLSKGLSAPVGSVLCGSNEFIDKARRIRKQLGGGMRQAGILAAAGIVAIEKMIDRLAEDHRRAKLLAKKLSKISAIKLDPGSPYTNMIFLTVDKEKTPYSASQISKRLLEYGIKTSASGSDRFRLVTHYWISDQDIEKIASAFNAVI
jgi:threonine aldolase